MSGSRIAIVTISLTLTACVAPTSRDILTSAVDIAVASQADYIYGKRHPSEPGGMQRWCHDCDERHFAMSHSRVTEAEAAARRDQLTSDLFEYLEDDMVSYYAHSCVLAERTPYELSAVLQERFDALLGPVPEEWVQNQAR